ncbi:MAG TPA: thermonuclease family protein [Dehalococcoidia bacterium]|nr:thermonuclease family protein [Dehalococcoidia bacterium]
MRNFVSGLLAGACVILFLILQIRFDVIGKVESTINTVGSVASTIQGFLDPCDTTMCCEDCPKLEITRIIDGDTFDSPVGRVRLFGVDTPERGERCFSEATERLEELAGDAVRVQEDFRKRDVFGRRLYYVYTENGESIDEKLIREGYGRAWTQDGQYRNAMIAVGMRAQRERSGCIWKLTFPWTR